MCLTFLQFRFSLAIVSGMSYVLMNNICYCVVWWEWSYWFFAVLTKLTPFYLHHRWIWKLLFSIGVPNISRNQDFLELRSIKPTGEGPFLLIFADQMHPPITMFFLWSNFHWWCFWKYGVVGRYFCCSFYLKWFCGLCVHICLLNDLVALLMHKLEWLFQGRGWVRWLWDKGFL